MLKNMLNYFILFIHLSLQSIRNNFCITCECLNVLYWYIQCFRFFSFFKVQQFLPFLDQKCRNTHDLTPQIGRMVCH